MPGHYQHENNRPPVEQSYIPIVRGAATENGHFVTPTDHLIRTGAHSNSHLNLGGRSNEYHTSNISMEIQHLPPPFSRPAFDPYAHTSTNRNTPLMSVGPFSHVHSTHGIFESGWPLKRKTPTAFEGSSSSFYGAESSSSSQMLVQNTTVDCLSHPPYRGSNLSISGPDSIRNVRRRSGPELEPSQYYHPTITHPANYSVPVHPVNLSAGVTGQEWNVVPYAASYNGRTSHSDINDPRRETSQFYGGGSSVDTNASHHNPYFRGNLASSSQNPHVSHVQPTRDGQNYHHQSVTPFYRNGPNYCNYNGGSSSTNEQLQFPSENFSSQYSRYSAAGGWGGGGYSGGRPGITVERLQPFVDVMDSHGGFEHEAITIEQPSFYHEPISFPDGYQDMRLDIDRMSYEELLALEERIGYVSSGLSEDGMSNCLWEKIYCPMDQNHDPCPICLEEYKNGEKIGRMKKCGHEYHVDCIKKWLVMKKVCPICKSEQ
ncbi:hypothetical protein L1987_62203 [Smallanthus sonchifolius]|uniref:Uncharacterized protein n=1 Tax=Smallanthus sonchifolius TaxID=185202 RepID=A0ACB9C9T5_9ASTR|nr:hypothetical protein L1987_62203 [Smallanthus sonchifolius]